ncbi:hypothetical protein IJT17_08065 [bacterium]|nr:hypothetical protein [bacterium]
MLYHDAKISADECLPLMRELVQQSPGGLLALAWLCRLGPIRADELLEFISGLACGEPLPDALDAKDSVEVFEVLTQGMQYKTGSLRCLISCFLMANIYMSANGRKECLARVMNLPAFSHTERSWLFAWALGEKLDRDWTDDSISIPAAPLPLARLAVGYIVDMGRSATDVVRQVIDDIDSREEKSYVLNGILDLIDRDSTDLQASMRKRAFEVCLASDDPALRRRTYRIASRTETKEFLQQATKDRDASVRTWAIAMLKGR